MKLLYNAIKYDLVQVLGKSLALHPRMVHWVESVEGRVVKATQDRKNVSLYNATYSSLVNELRDQFGFTPARAEKVVDLML